MNLVFVLVTLVATGLLYLSHPHQGWRDEPLPARPWRYISLLLLALGLIAALYSFTTITAIFAWLTINLLSFSLLPFFSLIIKKPKL